MSSWDWQLLGCFERGAKAFGAGKAIEDCPYKGHRGLNRQRAEYWRDGWKAKQKGVAYKEHRALRDVL